MARRARRLGWQERVLHTADNTRRRQIAPLCRLQDAQKALSRVAVSHHRPRAHLQPLRAATLSWEMHSSNPIVGMVNLYADGGVAASRIVRDILTHSSEPGPEQSASRHRLEDFAGLHRSLPHHPPSAHARSPAARLAARMRLVARPCVLFQGCAQATRHVGYARHGAAAQPSRMSGAFRPQPVRRRGSPLSLSLLDEPSALLEPARPCVLRWRPFAG